MAQKASPVDLVGFGFILLRLSDALKMRLCIPFGAATSHFMSSVSSVLNLPPSLPEK